MSAEEIIEFKPREGTPEQWAMLHEYRRIIHNETRPEDPITPDDVVETQMKLEHPHYYSKYFRMVQDGRIIGAFGGGAPKPEAPDYDENGHLLWGNISVRPELRRQGIGRRFLPIVLQLMNEYGNTIFTTGTEQTEGHEFLQWVGAAEKMTGSENRLNFTEIDWALIDAWIKEGVERNPDTKLELYEDRLPDSFLEEYAPVYTECGNQQPFDELDHGDFKFTPEVFREQAKRLEQSGGKLHTYVTREPSGEISGLTEIIWFPFRPKHLTQNLTGVIDKFRGRGLGKWLKAQMLDYARKSYPDLQWVITGNAYSNDAMLSINKRLGFQEYKGGSTYQIGKEDLEKFVVSKSI